MEEMLLAPVEDKEESVGKIGFKREIHVNKAQKAAIQKNITAARFTYNWGCRKLQGLYEEDYDINIDGIASSKVKNIKNFRRISKEFTQFKKLPENAWLRECDAKALDCVVSPASIGALYTANKKFWNEKYFKKDAKGNYGASEILADFYERQRKLRSKKGEEASLKFPADAKGFPKPHKWSSKGSYTTVGRIKDGKLYLPKIKGGMKIKGWDRRLEGTLADYITVSTDGIDFFVSVKTEYRDNDLNLQNLEGVLGVDVGCRKLATLSDGTKVLNPATSEKVKKYERKCKRLQRKISTLQTHARLNNDYIETPYGNKRLRKSNKLRRLERYLRSTQIKIENIKEDNRKQSVAHLLKRVAPESIVVENIAINNMKKNKKVAKGIQKTSMGTWLDWLKYKAERNGVNVIKADRFFASSQICSNCGYKNKEMKKGYEVFKCPKCGMVMDRDENAAVNLKNYVEK